MSSTQNLCEVMVCERTDCEVTDRPAQKVPLRDPSPETFRNATRIQESLTSAVERRVLIWVAARMPYRIGPDHLTCLGFAAMLLAGGSYFLARWYPVGLLLATFFLGVNWFGDSLDGTLARVRGRQRPRYGFYVDHMIDSFGGLFLISGLGASGYIQWQIALSMLIAFFLLSIESYLAAYTLGSFRLSFGKFGPTEIRILLGAGNIALWLNSKASIPIISWRLFDFGGVVATVGMAAMVIIAAAWHAATLYKQETLS
jgi:archaetidylinositol phosphate synthase